MNHKLIYTLGPSGAGKDSLLAWLKFRVSSNAPVHFARRVIDRPSQADGEQHEVVKPQDFDQLRNANAFALDWAANGHQYGIRHAEVSSHVQNQWVFVNGSRGNLTHALQQFPGLTVLHVTAHPDLLLNRLLARKRETLAEVQSRVQRSIDWHAPPGCLVLEVINNTSLDEAGQSLLQALEMFADWPRV